LSGHPEFEFTAKADCNGWHYFSFSLVQARLKRLKSAMILEKKLSHHINWHKHTLAVILTYIVVPPVVTTVWLFMKLLEKPIRQAPPRYLQRPQHRHQSRQAGCNG
jgi:hypothetical protein